MTESIRKLVAGVAAMNDMDPVIPYAAALGARTDLPLDVIHVFDVSDPFVQSYMDASIFPGDPLQKYCEGLQARLEGLVGSLAGRGEVHCRAVPGKPSEVLRQAAAEPDTLLLVGPTHRRRATAALLGTTAQRVLHGTENPVLVLRGELAPKPRVLYCVDLFTADAARVVRRGAAIARDLSNDQPRESRLITVVKLEMELALPELEAQVSEAATKQLQTFAGALPDAVAFEQTVRTGVPAREIVEEATDWSADLVVVGTQARAGVARAVLGSVAESVVRDAPCNVLVIPSQRD